MCTSINKSTEDQLRRVQGKHKNECWDETCNGTVKAETEARITWLGTKKDEHKRLY